MSIPFDSTTFITTLASALALAILTSIAGHWFGWWARISKYPWAVALITALLVSITASAAVLLVASKLATPSLTPSAFSRQYFRLVKLDQSVEIYTEHGAFFLILTSLTPQTCGFQVYNPIDGSLPANDTTTAAKPGSPALLEGESETYKVIVTIPVVNNPIGCFGTVVLQKK